MRSPYAVTKPSELEFQLTRTYAAPKATIFRAFVEAALIPEWWGFDAETTQVYQLDARPGGNWRYAMKSSDGAEMNFFGEFISISAPDLITYTFQYDGEPGKVMLESITLTEVDGITTMEDLCRFSNQADRDHQLEQGMADGAQLSLDRLATLVERLQKESAQ